MVYAGTHAQVSLHTLTHVRTHMMLDEAPLRWDPENTITTPTGMFICQHAATNKKRDLRITSSVSQIPLEQWPVHCLCALVSGLLCVQHCDLSLHTTWHTAFTLTWSKSSGALSLDHTQKSKLLSIILFRFGPSNGPGKSHLYIWQHITSAQCTLATLPRPHTSTAQLHLEGSSVSS